MFDTLRLKVTYKQVVFGLLTIITGIILFNFNTLNTRAVGNGLVAAYNFDAASGNTLNDRSGNNNNGTLNGPVWSGSGKNSGALQFDGSNDFVSVADADSLDLSTGMTLGAWVYPTSLGNSWRTIIFKERPGGMVYSLFANNHNTRPLGQVDISGEKNAVGTTALPLNAWSHITTTYDGANLKFYLNGTLVSTTPVTGNIPNSTGMLKLGGNSIWAEWFQGKMDDMRIYNRALDASEIQYTRDNPVN